MRKKLNNTRRKSKWGNSKAYQEYEQRAVSDSEHNYLKFANEIMSLFTELGAMKQLPPTDKAVQEKVVALQAYINENFYTCSNDILKELGEMYVCDDRFKKNIDCFGGEGTAEFVRDAISIYCDKESVNMNAKWILCPICGNKTRVQIRKDTKLNLAAQPSKPV